eukprot:TRINITY_DN2946_c0_g1_i4.p1 TRINITY_DN2946_c0_g1~~TRINITY_DN2946_c0_g1_i4.p1  ORF type:complete len:137 (-),score=25.38 TRINITY_DN2946_c0_g1_i4:18-428(-)
MNRGRLVHPFPTPITSIPLAKGSNVPPCPIFTFLSPVLMIKFFLIFLTTSVDVHPIGLNTGTIPLRFMLLSIFLLLSYYSIKQSLPPPLSLSLLSLSSFIFQHNPLFDTKMIPPPFVFYCQIYSRVVLIYTRVINR